MTDSIWRLNCWVLGDHPACTFVVRLPSHYTVLELKQLIKRTQLHDVDTEYLRIWSVDIEMVTLGQIKDESHIKGGIELVSRFTTLSEVFWTKPGPNQISIIVSYPSALNALRALYEAVWNKPGSLVSQQTVAYKIGDGESKEKTCDVFNLGEHAQRLRLLGFVLGPQLVVTKEYKDAFEFIGIRFSQKMPSGGFVVTGQPGIGKSLFLVYVLLKRMQEALPVALHVSSTGYYLADDKGVLFHKNSSIGPLVDHQRIWCLSNSTYTTNAPTEDFLRSEAAQIIQAATPQMDLWRSWVKEFRGGLYVMDTWDEGELALLASLQGGEESVSKMLQLSSEWGPSPRYLMQALDTQDDSLLAHDWENSMTREINMAVANLAADPLRALTSAMSIAHCESITSPLLWVRPQNKVKNRLDFDTYIPDATRIAEAVRGALEMRSTVELASYFNFVSHSPHSRGLAGCLFESLMHSTMTSGSQPFTWYALDGSSGRVLPVTSNQVISGRGELKTAVAPFYFLPGLENYPGIDSVLCTGQTVYAIQATLSPKHVSALGGLQKLYDELPPDHRPPKKTWCLLFANPEREQGQHLAETQWNAIPENSKWKSIKTGYFTPLHMKEFAPVTKSGEKGKGCAIEEDLETPEQSTAPSTSSAPMRDSRQRKRPKMQA